MEGKEEKYPRAFISYIDEDGTKKEGYFDNVFLTPYTVSFDLMKNRLILPWARIIKVKVSKEGE